MEDYFLTKPETPNVVRLPTIITKRPKLTQLTLVDTFGTSPITCQSKTKKTKKRKGIQCKLLEEWNTPSGKRQIRKRNKLHRKKLNGTSTQGNDKETNTNLQTEIGELVQTQNWVTVVFKYKHGLHHDICMFKIPPDVSCYIYIYIYIYIIHIHI